MAILYIATFIIFAYVNVKSILKDGYLSLFSVFYLTIAFLYLLAPALMFINKPNYTVWSIHTINQSSDSDRMYAWVVVVITLIVLNLARRAKIKQFTIKAYDDNPIPSETTVAAIRSVCKPWFFVLLVLGSIGFILMASQIGISGFIRFSGHSRGVTGTIGGSGSVLGYAQFLSKFLIASLAPGILLYQSNKNGLLKIGLIILFIASLLIEVFIAGKSNFIIFIVPFAMLLLSDRRGKMKRSRLVLLAVLALAAVFVLDNLFYYLQYGISVSTYRTAWNTHDYISRYLREFAYAYANLLNSRSIISKMGYRFFIDYPAVIINLLPAVLLGGLQIKPAYTVVDSYYGLVGMDSLSPADYMIFGMLQLDVLALWLITFFRGNLFKEIDYRIKKLRIAFTDAGINGSHILTCCACFGVVSVLIEPFNAIRTQPILICSIFICLSIYRKLKNVERARKD